MISKELREQLEKIPCTLKDGGFFQYKSEGKKGIEMKCPVCEKKGLSNTIFVEVKKKILEAKELKTQKGEKE